MMQRVAHAGPVLNALSGAFTQQNRNMATLKAIQIRLKSVKNIQKITQSMKMVSAAKWVSFSYVDTIIIYESILYEDNEHSVDK